MAMKKEERKNSYGKVISLILNGKNKEAYEALTCMCGQDTGLFFLTEYDEIIKKSEAKKTTLSMEKI